MAIRQPITCFGFLWLDTEYWWATVSACVVVLILLYVFRYQFFVRLPLWLLTHTFYRVRVHGLENIPEEGPALLVCNHVSQLDALLVLAAQKRKIRFVIWSAILSIPLLRVILRFGRVIPIDSSSPRTILRSLRTASEALAAGEVVCIFAEGGITRTGFLLPFQRGFTQIVKRTPAPIIPVCLDHVWGSIFSYHRHRFFWKLPKMIPYPVWVSFGKPLPADATPFQVHQTIQRLSAESSVRRASVRAPVHRQFVRQAVRHPFRDCFFEPINKERPRLNYAKALVGAKILTNKLRPILSDDKMVGLWLPPSAGGALANVAVAFLGKTSVNLNYTVSTDALQSAVRQCGIRHILTSRVFLKKVPMDAGPDVELVYLEDFRKTISKWQQIRALLSVLLFPRFIQERWILGLGKHNGDDLATVIFSSGSTGEPKGIMLSHSNVAANAESMIQAIDLQKKDRLVAILPFFHSFGYTVTLWAPLQAGASSIFYPNPLQPKEIGEVVREYKGTIFLSTPTFLRSYLKRCQADDFKTVRLLVCGAEKLPPRLAAEFKEKFGVEPLEGYGCTELSPAAAANVPDWEHENIRQIGNKSGTIGQPLPGVAAKIGRNGATEPNVEGQLLMYGANVMKGYLGNEELTKAKVVDGGWYITGDLAEIDEDGFITITGREERFAKVGGEMIPLERVEEEIHTALETNDKVCAVTAIPDEKKGERLVVLHLPLEGIGVDEIRKKLSVRGLPNIFIPAGRDFYEVEELPTLGAGKLDIKKCKNQAMELAGVERNSD